MKISEFEKLLVGFDKKSNVSGTELEGYSIDLVDGFSVEIAVPDSESENHIDAINVYFNNPLFGKIMSDLFCDANGVYSKESIGHQFSPKRLRKDFSTGCLTMSSPSILKDKGWFVLNGGVQYEIGEFIERLVSLRDRQSIYEFYLSDMFSDFFVAVEGAWVSIFFSAYNEDLPEGILAHINELKEEAERARTWRTKSDFDISIARVFYERFCAHRVG